MKNIHIVLFCIGNSIFLCTNVFADTTKVRKIKNAQDGQPAQYILEQYRMAKDINGNDVEVLAQSDVLDASKLAPSKEAFEIQKAKVDLLIQRIETIKNATEGTEASISDADVQAQRARP
jgi:hypothetical protein